MKILQLRFKNINSLAGNHELDFTKPEFAETGIFAITGKTGSGKSSILDAISLALYGRTPRVNVTGSNNDVMTRGENDCYSEIIFESKGKKWKAAWKQERSRTKTLKQIEHCIADENDKIISDKTSETNKKIVEILGLNFEQFTKVILLAQGGFTAFLQANKEDKGELLEQITGTKIYADISKKIFEHSKLENQKLDTINIELAAINFISEEEIQKLQNEILNFEKQKKQLDEDLQLVENAKKWQKDLIDMQKKIDEAKTQTHELKTRNETAEAALKNAENNFKAKKAEQEASAPIFVKIRELETTIAEKNKTLNPILETIKTLEAEIAKHKKELSAKIKAFDDAEKELNNGLELKDIKNKELESKKNEQNTLLNGELIAYYRSEILKTAEFGSGIKNLIESLSEMFSNKAEIDKNSKIIAENSEKEIELSLKIETDKNELKNLENQINLLRENIDFRKTIHSLEEHRNALEDGKECPLCGSIEHPFAKGNVPQIGEREKELKNMELQFKNLSSKNSTDEKKLEKTKSDKNNAEENKQAIEKKLNQNKNKTEKIQRELKQLEREIPEISEDANYIEELEKIRKEEQGKYSKINVIIKKYEKIDKLLSDLRDNEIPKINSEIDEKKSKLNILQNEITGLQISAKEKQEQITAKKTDKEKFELEKQNIENERKNIFGDKKVEDEENKLKKSIENAEREKSFAEKAKNETATKLAEINAIIEENQKQLIAKKEEKITEKTIEELQLECNEKKIKTEDFSQKIGAGKQTLNTNKQNIEKSRQKLAEKEKQQIIRDKWKLLDNLIGSLDGKKFRNYAQSLTFENLIALSNKQLQKMSERYILKRNGDISNPFDLLVIDKFQNCEERTAQNLSGGEKFIVSLSLALGLSNMASRNMRIDTMFIDEGFGTLDSDYLDVALTALSNLQSEGKLIGVISHLSELKERIATHVAIVPVANGRSKVEF